jgi:hypothetical protein
MRLPLRPARKMAAALPNPQRAMLSKPKSDLLEFYLIVLPGLGPGTHEKPSRRVRRLVDGRVKPGQNERVGRLFGSVYSDQ